MIFWESIIELQLYDRRLHHNLKLEWRYEDGLIHLHFVITNPLRMILNSRICSKSAHPFILFLRKELKQAEHRVMRGISCYIIPASSVWMQEFFPLIRIKGDFPLESLDFLMYLSKCYCYADQIQVHSNHLDIHVQIIHQEKIQHARFSLPFCDLSLIGIRKTEWDHIVFDFQGAR